MCFHKSLSDRLGGETVGLHKDLFPCGPYGINNQPGAVFARRKADLHGCTIECDLLAMDVAQGKKKSKNSDCDYSFNVLGFHIPLSVAADCIVSVLPSCLS